MASDSDNNGVVALLLVVVVLLVGGFLFYQLGDDDRGTINPEVNVHEGVTVDRNAPDRGGADDLEPEPDRDR